MDKGCKIPAGLRKEKVQGSIAVEAAFVFPIVIFTIFALIYLAFYLHDRCRIQGEVDKVLHRAGISMKHEAEIETGEIYYEHIEDRGVFYLIVGNTEQKRKQITDYMQQELASGLFLYKISIVKSEVDNFKVTLSVEAERKIFLPYFTHSFDPFAEIKITDNCAIHNPAETIRCTEVILETGAEIKGVAQLKEKLEEFLEVN